MDSDERTTERRAEERRGWWFPVRVHYNNAQINAVCRDLTSRGMQLAVAEHLEIGTSVELAFSVPGGSSERTLRGTILRAEDNPDDDSRVLWPCTVGVELDKPDDALAELSASESSSNLRHRPL